jgi:potassium efflux system protein
MYGGRLTCRTLIATICWSSVAIVPASALGQSTDALMGVTHAAPPVDGLLVMSPAEYGASIFADPRATGPSLTLELQSEDETVRLAALLPLRSDFDAGTGARWIEPTSYTAEVEPDSPSQSDAAVLEDIDLDGRQAISLNADLEEAVRVLLADVARLEEAWGADKTPEVAKRLQVVRDLLAAVQTKGREAREWDARTKSLPQEVAVLQQVLTQGMTPPSDSFPASNVADGQKLLDVAREGLQQYKQEFEQYHAAHTGRGQAKSDLEAEIANFRKQLEAFPPIPPVDESLEAQTKQLEARVQLLDLKVNLLRDEEKWKHLSASDEWAQLKRDVSQLRVAEQESIVELVAQRVSDSRRMEIQEQARQAERDAEKVDVHARSLTLYAEDNSQLVAHRRELTKKIEAASVEIDGLTRNLETVKEQRGRLESKVAVAGMNHTVGRLMRMHRHELPNISEHARRIRQIEREMPDIQLLRIELEDSRDQIVDVTGVIQGMLNELAETEQVHITASVESAVTELVNTRKQLIRDLIQDFANYIEQLSQVDSLSRELIEQIRTSQYFVDKHVLWIRSTEPLSRADFRKTGEALLAVTRSLQPEVANFDWRSTMKRWSPLAIWTVVILLVAIATRQRVQRALANTTEQMGRSATRHLSVVVRMLSLMILVAAFWPAICWGIGQYLSVDTFDAGSTANSLGHALLSIVPFVALACIVSQWTKRNGFAEKYLAWPEPAIAAVHRAAHWYLYTVAPFRCAGVFFDNFQNGAWAASAGRVAFILSQLALFFCLNLAIRQASAAMVSSNPGAPRSFWMRTRRIWSTGIALAPLALAGMSLIGYHYSASELAYRFSWTIWLILGAVALLSLAQQIVQIVLQKISLRRFWQDRVREADHPSAEPAEEFDAEKTNHQIAGLLRGFTFAGVVLSLFLIWSQVLPAIQVLDQVELWPVKLEVAENVLGTNGEPQLNPDGKPLTRMVSKVQNITLADVAWAAICLVFTVIVSRNLPGLLEVTLLDRLPLDRGGKYAISVVCRYLVAIVGIVMAARCLGFEWSSVQWLVAAMSVGLGFGLQEIFGNFVSGMIILLERPIRVGDLVTVNGTTGCVTRIQLRATTITDADRREMIVPNKKFITDDVVNWTLTDPITRVVIPIGIAYHSNTELACQTLLEVARRHPHVMRDPEPTAVFTRFGPSSLDLELRVYIATREHFPDVQHALLLAIDRAFHEKQIEIAYPQQEVHIREPAAMAKALLAARHEIRNPPPRGQNAA